MISKDNLTKIGEVLNYTMYGLHSKYMSYKNIVKDLDRYPQPYSHSKLYSSIHECSQSIDNKKLCVVGIYTDNSNNSYFRYENIFPQNMYILDTIDFHMRTLKSENQIQHTSCS